MSISAFAVKYRPIIISVVLLLMAWGSYSFFNMPRREDPEFTIRVCVVSTAWPGAPAEKVEELITDKIEEDLISIEEVDEVRSTTTTGQSVVYVELDDRIAPADIQNVWDKVRAKVNLVQMPDPAVKPVVNDEFGDTAVLVLAVHQTPLEGESEVRELYRYTYRQLEEFADTISDSLRLLDGVAKVEKFGVREEAIYIETDMGNWAQLGLSTQQLEQLASNRNIIEPGGQIDTDAGQVNVKPGGEFDAVSEITNIAGTVRSGEQDNQVYLSELGLTVTRSYEDPASYICRYGDTKTSEPAVMVAVTMKSGSNIIDVCDAAKARVDQIIEAEKLVPADIAATPISDQSENVAAKISEVIVNVMEAIVIVIIVVYIVVGFRASFVMAANIPVVVIAAVGIITFFGVQLEQISLAALIISLGLLVDNAVQVCDQARTNQMAGMKPFRAAIEGANSLAIPMLVGTLTTMAAFVPMLFALQGGSKEYVYSLPVTVSTTLGLSWILAMTFCVILAGLLIRADAESNSSPISTLFDRLTGKTKKHDSSDSKENFFLTAYGNLAHLVLMMKWPTVIGIAVLCAAMLSLPVSSEFFPEADRDQFAVKVTLPETATIAQADAIAKQVEDIIRKLSPVRDGETKFNEQEERLRAMRTMVGGGGSRWHLGWDPEPPTRNFAEILIRTTDGRYTADYTERLRIVCESGDPELGIEPVVGARIVPIKLALGPPADPLLLRVIGSGFADPVLLGKTAEKLRAIVDAQPETWNVNDSWGVLGYQVQVNTDEDRATLAGVTNSQVARTLNSYYTGLKLTTFREDDQEVPIYFRLRSTERDSIRGLQEAYVEGENIKVPLASIAEFEFTRELAKIMRRDMNRVIEVSARMLPGVSGNDVVDRVLNLEATKELQASLPPDFKIEPGGSYEESQDAAVQMAQSFLASFALIVLCLICQYNGWAKPILILATLPLALVGALFGLWATDNSLGFMPQLGILALFGIVLNTAIIFVEFADLLIAEKAGNSKYGGPYSGVSKAEFRECLVQAGKQRMLPIFLTTATTVGGLVPLALTGGPLWVGLAWCMIFGLMFATILTLLFVPALYAILVETFKIKPLPSYEEDF